MRTGGRGTRLSVALALGFAATATLSSSSTPAGAEPPRTGFETRNGASWTTHEEELSFLETVDARSDRVAIEIIGRTAQDRPLHLVRIGHPVPRARADALREPVQFHMCTQHGNEPAGREACLQWLRDLAFTTEPTLIRQMQKQTLLFVPTANPDGRNANTRGNSAGTDINRDHLNVATPEARAIGAVIRDWRPAFVIDHHEYGPGEPVLYDDDVLYLWPRNLNVDPPLRALGKSFSVEHLKPCLTQYGYTSDEYGLEAVGDTDVNQSAGDHDEGIARNTAGLRHAVGILVESATSPKKTAPTEALDSAQNQRRRVASHWATIDCALAYARETIDTLYKASVSSRARAAAVAAKRPVYFNGQDEDTTLTGTRDEPTSVADPPPCAYRLTDEQNKTVSEAFKIHDVASTKVPSGWLVPLAQESEPVIALLLDARAARHAVKGRALDKCPVAKRGPTLVLPKQFRRDRVLAETGIGRPVAAAAAALAVALLGLLALAEPRTRRAT